jgi:aldehyde dehydrogenase (NAD+)
MITHDQLFIGGDWVAPAGTDVIDVVCPHTEEVIGRVPDGTTADMDRAVAAARAAFDTGPWPRTDPAERAAAVGRLAKIFASRMGEMAELISQEMGTPISFAHAVQTPWPLSFLTYYAQLGADYPWEEQRPGMVGPVTVCREPIGVVAAIVPWNVPQFLITTKLAPALIAGCTIVLKPAPETPLDPYLLAEMVDQAEIPAGVVNIVAAGRDVGEYLVSHPGVDKVAFTGSTRAGRRVGAICGQQIKRCSLELGGKSAAIVLDDADLTATMEWVKMAPLGNNGQTCVAQSRILASRGRYQAVVDALADTVAAMTVGDPADPATEIGPLAAKRQQERVEGYLRLGEAEGATVVVGGPAASGKDKGWYVAPTVFAGVDNSMRIAREEIFGPVLTVIAFQDEADAVRIANDSDYGLSGAVWTGDINHGMHIARQIRTGSYGINTMYMFDPATPFGGYKCSGIGRELGPEGLSSYLEYKSIACTT